MAFQDQSGNLKAFHVSDNAFFIFALALYTGVTLAILTLSFAFMKGIWSVGDTKIFFKMADLILQGGTPYVDFADPKPPLIFFTLAVPDLLGEKVLGGLLLVVLCNLGSAILVMAMASKLYGRLPGFAAGLLFMTGMAFTEGYFIIIEPFTLLFILLATYILLFSSHDKKYLLAGICAGIAIGFKQYALLMLPLALFYMYRKGELRGVIQLIIGALTPLLIMYAAIFLVYGTTAGTSALFWSFGIADDYVTQGSVDGIALYPVSDPLVGVADLLLEASLLMTLLILALFEFLWDRPVTHYEEFFFLAGLAFLSTLAIRPYLHYWALAIPFIVLLCVRRFRGHSNDSNRPVKVGSHSMASLSKSAYFLAAALLYGFVLFFLDAVTYIVTQNIWRPYDILSYYGVADPAARIVGPYLGTQARPFLLFTVHLPGNTILSGLLIVGLLNLFCALIIMLIGLRLYGREAGLLAGLLFVVNIAWTQGYFTLTEPLALLLTLLSAYALFCLRGGTRYLIAGLCAGAAICFAPFVVLLAPVAIFAIHMKKEIRGVLTYIAGILAAIAIIYVIALTLIPGLPLTGYDLQVAISYVDSYRLNDAMASIADIALSICMLAVLLPLAILGFARCGRRSPETYFMVVSLALILTLFSKEYMNYWLFALPCLALLCACCRRPVIA